MIENIRQNGGAMAITLRAFANGDDCYLVWSSSRIENCWGFAIHREVTTRDGRTFSGYLKNRVGFTGDDNPPHGTRRSSQWPFQRYTWTDHGINEGDRASYWVAPVIHQADGSLHVAEDQKAEAGPVTFTPDAGNGAGCYFNRGIILSQFISRELGDEITEEKLRQLKDSLTANDNRLRTFLTGDLGRRLRELLVQAKDEGREVFAVLYELADAELIARLADLGARAHVVLANGSDKSGDGNAASRQTLKDAGVDVRDRLLRSKGLGHNKFLVICDPEGKPEQVWTGSTNWATSGLCTQINNGLLVQDVEVARIYREQFDRLAAAGSSFPDELVEANSQPKRASSGGVDWTVWFTRTSDRQELDACRELINGAKQGILFLMFEPGNSGLLQDIFLRRSPASATFDESLYIQGVVNTLKNPQSGTTDVQLVARGQNRSFDLDIIQPEGVGGSLGQWAAEVTRKEFLTSQGGVFGFAIIHSKVIVIDPLSDRPVVITGSHNFSASASGKNDENLVIVEGNRRLAEEYAVNVLSVYNHYRWRAFLRDAARAGVTPWDGLRKDDRWQDGMSADRRRELEFWLA
jgi:phosphatidylserine/phosphatidylglycerophosphate/cardiolipin synthase-like enzyme